MSNESGIPTFTKDRLPEPPECKWADFRKVTTTRAAKILGPFNVETIHGGAPQRCNFGREAPDSDMVAGSAIGSGGLAGEAVDGVVSELKLEVVDPDVARDAEAAEEGAGC